MQFVVRATIKAPAHVVYDVITNFREYHAWNHTFTCENPENARAEIGAFVDISWRWSNGKIQRVRHLVLEATPSRVFAWQGTGWVNHLVLGARRREITAIPGTESVVLVVTENVTGPLSWLVQLLYKNDLKRIIDTETAEIKSKAEAIANGPQV